MPLTKPSRASQQFAMSPTPQAGYAPPQSPSQAPTYGNPAAHSQPQYYPPQSNYPAPMGPPPNSHPNNYVGGAGHSRGPSGGGGQAAMYSNYPPQHNGANASQYGPPPQFQQGQYAKGNVTQMEQAQMARGLNRTPSPTPSEVKALNPPAHRGLDFWLRKEWICAC